MVIYCDVTSLLFFLDYKQFAMDEELYQYTICIRIVYLTALLVSAQKLHLVRSVGWMTTHNIDISAAILTAQLWT